MLLHEHHESKDLLKIYYARRPLPYHQRGLLSSGMLIHNVSHLQDVSKPITISQSKGSNLLCTVFVKNLILFKLPLNILQQFQGQPLTLRESHCD